MMEILHWLAILIAWFTQHTGVGEGAELLKPLPLSRVGYFMQSF